MDALVEKSGPKITRRRFLQMAGAAAASIIAAVAPDVAAQPRGPNFTPILVKPESPIVISEEKKEEQKVKLYDDLTPGIGIGLAWVGSGSPWNTIVENFIKASTAVDVTPYVYVPRYSKDTFNAFLVESGIPPEACHKVLCDPEYEVNDDAVEVDSGKHKSVIKSGFPSSWIRDWGTWTAVDGSETVQLGIRKDGMVDPLRGTGIDLKMFDVGLRFDGGSFFYGKRKDDSSFFLASENELINNNSYRVEAEKSDGVDIRQEVTSRIQKVFGNSTEIIYLPRLMDNGVDHIDTFVMPLGEDNMVVGEALEGDKNYEILNGVANMFEEKGFNVQRVPIRRLGDNNTVSFTNILAHITSNGERFLFMPTYDGFEAEGDSAKKIYRDLGFKIVPVDATSTRDKGGAVHCATNTSITAPFMQLS